MSERSTEVVTAEAGTGSRIATRDANAQDASANDRDVQYVDESFGRATADLSTPTRSVTGVDTNDLSTVPTDIVSNKLTVGEETIFWVCAHVKYSSLYDDQAVIITPIELDDSDNFVAWLDPVLATGVRPGGAGAEPLKYVDGSDTWVPSKKFYIAVKGATYIGLHVEINGENIDAVKIYAGLTSGRPDDYAATAVPENRAESTDFVDIMFPAGG